MTLNVLMLSPGYPAEMPFFTRGLARVGARVIGLGDQPKEMLPPMAREHVAHHLQVRSSVGRGGDGARGPAAGAPDRASTASSASGSRG